jgi:hypothetical protein
MVLLPADLSGDDEMGVLQHLQVFHDPEPAHRQMSFDLGKRPAVLLAQEVENGAADGMTEGTENGVHGAG